MLKTIKISILIFTPKIPCTILLNFSISLYLVPQYPRSLSSGDSNPPPPTGLAKRRKSDITMLLQNQWSCTHWNAHKLNFFLSLLPSHESCGDGFLAHKISTQVEIELCTHFFPGLKFCTKKATNSNYYDKKYLISYTLFPHFSHYTVRNCKNLIEIASNTATPLYWGCL